MAYCFGARKVSWHPPQPWSLTFLKAASKPFQSSQIFGAVRVFPISGPDPVGKLSGSILASQWMASACPATAFMSSATMAAFAAYT